MNGGSKGKYYLSPGAKFTYGTDTAEGWLLDMLGLTTLKQRHMGHVGIARHHSILNAKFKRSLSSCVKGVLRTGIPIKTLL